MKLFGGEKVHTCLVKNKSKKTADVDLYLLFKTVNNYDCNVRFVYLLFSLALLLSKMTPCRIFNEEGSIQKPRFPNAYTP